MMIFKNNSFYSKEYDDIYFSLLDPVGESNYVFSSCVDEIAKESIVVAESGFGTGLNFFTTIKRLKNKKLHYISIEKNPLTKEQLREVYSHLNVFKDELEKLLLNYPSMPISGLWRIKYSDNITLDLFFGDIDKALDELDFKADIWYLDGFAPSKNPDMWSKEILEKISYLLKQNGIITTFSAAGALKRALKSLDFELKIQKGFQNKKEMIRAVLKKEKTSLKEIWFQRAKNSIKKRVVVVGGGIAGCASAFGLKKAGFDVVLVEKNELATGASSNPYGALLPLIAQKNTEIGLFHLIAFKFAKEFYRRNLTKELVEFNDAICYAYDKELEKRYKNSFECFKFDQNSAPYPSITIKNAAILQPKKCCKFLVDSADIDVRLGWNYSGFILQKDGSYTLFCKDDEINCDIIVFAMGHKSMELFDGTINSFDENLKLSSVRGQTTFLKNGIKTDIIINSKGYAIPPHDGYGLIGSTYDRGDFDESPRQSDDLKNIEKLKEFIDFTPEVIGSNVGHRSYSSDRFPVIGALHDAKLYKESYKALLWQKNSISNPATTPPSYLPNIYITTAHGSRGLGTAILGAELLLDYILNRPFCLPKSLIQELHPARFLIRKLKKGLL